ncbi:hypothetical protein ODJ79_37195 [Actinoplanes sp. KI2]|uniref:hypothetical protein n=1 Tax=Actinoplanes sp. KI2 TaxID=2983315 RepID=UPI0021D605F1|nr:hypothetical protein [Actinoplanes sp. KI2]MCU7729385.1 hypothetical protein [Actinoplanes sp. KI2]
MQALTSLVGVLIGGLLVVLTDIVRRRYEWRKIQLQRLLDNGAELLAVHHQLAGDLIEAHDAGLPLANVHKGSADRYRVGTRFAATPGSEPLLADVEQLRNLHRLLRNAFDQSDRWSAALEAYVAAIHGFELKLRSIGARAR